MAKTPSRRIVIDASVAGRAGRIERSHPAGRMCREFLLAVKSICHRVVMTPDISEEWSRHQSSFASKWRTQMYARKKVESVDVQRDEAMLRKLEKSEATDRQHKEMLKDWRLIEATTATDACVASLDEEARSLFAKASPDVPVLNSIVWVNPEQAEEDPIGWLERGAKLEQQRMLAWSG
jgi:hypothetical protein